MTAPVGVASVAGVDAVQHRKLVDAAQQFEAMFLQELLKPMAASDKDGEADDGQGESGTLQSFGSESLAKSISSAGGLGIARKIVTDVEREHARRTPETLAERNVGIELKSSAIAPMNTLRREP